MMRNALRNLLYRMLGEVPARLWLRHIRGRSPAFSESDLVLTYFDCHPRRGVMVDAGAHYGESLEPYLRRNWRILAFEPDPMNLSELSRQVDISKLQLFPIALSDRSMQKAPFFASIESSGISSLSSFAESHRQVCTVEVRTLRDILFAQDVAQVDFLKIDTEGHDLFVLKGFPFELMRPEVVVCEFEDSKTKPLGYTHADLGDFLLKVGYSVFLSEWYPVERYGKSHRWRNWRAFPCQLSDRNAWGNFVAFSRAPAAPVLAGYLRRFQRDDRGVTGLSESKD